MKDFIKFFVYGILFSGILLFLTFLLDFAPLAGKSGSWLSNTLVTGLVLLGWGLKRIQSNRIETKQYSDIIYGVNHRDVADSVRTSEHSSQTRILSALGLFLAAAINLTISYFF